MVFICPLLISVLLKFTYGWVGLSEIFKFLFVIIFIVLLNIFCYLSNNLLIFLVSLEMTVFPMRWAILILSKDVDKFSSTSFIAIINIIGSVPFFFFFRLLIKCNNLSLLEELCFLNCPNFNQTIYYVSIIIIIISKLPVFFFHFWLTKAHVRASGACSMILAGLMLKVRSVGLYKFLKLFLSINYNLTSFFCSFRL